MLECEFCRIGAGEASAELVHEDAENMAFLPLRPAALGHTLVIPKSHYVDFFDLPTRPLAGLMQFVSVVGSGLRTTLCPDGMNVITSAGAAASQTVFHVHVHVVPRWRDDRFGSIWPPGRPAVGDAGREIAERLRQGFRKPRP
ncbi:HIT family protein [Streptomyces sp. NPDC057499]|uniref:HIT family protein n=1 Tax=Streptomyces sp. NPDC057499 TaxID=3346150 RepID=UPI0036CC03C3